MMDEQARSGFEYRGCRIREMRRKVNTDQDGPLPVVRWEITERGPDGVEQTIGVKASKADAIRFVDRTRDKAL